MSKKSKPEVEQLVAKTKAEIERLDQTTERMTGTLAEIERKLTDAHAAREELEKFSNSAVILLASGEITLEQFSANGTLIDAATAEIDRFSSLHDDTRELLHSYEQQRAELVSQLANRKEMLLSIEAESLAEIIIKKSGAELKQLLAVLGRSTDQPSGAIAGSLIETTLFRGGQLPLAEKREILKALNA